MEVNLKEKGTMVQALWDSVNRTSGSLSIVPGLIHRVLETGAWRERIHRGKTYRNESFLAFITTKPMQGCGWEPEKVEALLRYDPEVLVEWRDATMAPHGGDRKTAPIKSDNVTLDHQRGNSLAYTLSRLSRERPDLFDRVAGKELSAHAAAIEAGFRSKPSALDKIRKLLPELTPDQRAALMNELVEMRNA